MKALSNEVRKSIINLKMDGNSLRKISSSLQVSLASVKRICKRFKLSGTIEPTKNCGKKPKLNDKSINKLKNLAYANPHITRKELLEKFNIKVLNNISLRTMDRILKKHKYKWHMARRAPFISTINKRKRLNFAKNLLSLPPNILNRIIFSDESSIQMGSNFRPKVLRTTGQRNMPRFLTPSFKKSQSTMVWSCISRKGVGNIYLTEEKIDSLKYQEILTISLLPMIHELGPHVFIQDNAPIHVSRSTKVWFQEHGVNVRMDWPPQSPDLNPIENMWSLLKKNVAKHKCKSLAELKATIAMEWSNISQETCEKYFSSFRRRLVACVKSHGYPTKY